MLMFVEYLPCIGHTVKHYKYYRIVPHNILRKKLQIPLGGEQTGSENLPITSQGPEVAHSDSTAMRKAKAFVPFVP